MEINNIPSTTNNIYDCTKENISTELNINKNNKINTTSDSVIKSNTSVNSSQNLLKIFNDNNNQQEYLKNSNNNNNDNNDILSKSCIDNEFNKTTHIINFNKEIFDINSNIHRKSNNINLIHYNNTITGKSTIKSNLYKNKYKKIKKIGEGGYGSVYLVADDKNNIYVMKKYINDSTTNVINNLKYQFEIVKSLNNKINTINKDLNNLFEFKCVSKYYEYFIQDNKCFLIQDYYKVSLIEMLEFINKNIANTIKTDIIYKAIIYQLLFNALFMHKNNIIHRDLKPENIMISDDGSLIFIDFDLCLKTTETDLNKTKNSCGTICYQPAELFFGELNNNISTDLWSIGCIISEIYLGYQLFESTNEIGLLSKISDVLGAPNENNYPGVSKLPTYMPFISPEESGETRLFEKLFKYCDTNLLYIIENLLNLNPSKRLNFIEFTDIFNTYEEGLDDICNNMSNKLTINTKNKNNESNQNCISANKLISQKVNKIIYNNYKSNFENYNQTTNFDCNNFKDMDIVNSKLFIKSVVELMNL